jgi:hypothetical protein
MREVTVPLDTLSWLVSQAEEMVRHEHQYDDDNRVNEIITDTDDLIYTQLDRYEYRRYTDRADVYDAHDALRVSRDRREHYGAADQSERRALTSALETAERLQAESDDLVFRVDMDEVRAVLRGVLDGTLVRLTA